MKILTKWISDLAVTGAKIANLTITGGKIAASTITDDKLATAYQTAAAAASHASSTTTHGVSGNIVGSSDAQTLTNKRINGGTASSQNAWNVPAETKTNLVALTRIAGAVYWCTDELKYYGDNGTILVPIGGGAPPYFANFTGTSVTPDPDAMDQTFTYNGGSAQNFDATGFGTLTSLVAGQKFTLVGSDNDNTLTVGESDVTNGRIMNGPIELTRGRSITFIYNSTLGRMVEESRNF